MAKFPEVYRRAEWQRVREIVIARAQGLCEECLRRDGTITPGRDVHHIEHLTEANKDDWSVAYNPDNLMLLCGDCHAHKHGGGDTGLSNFMTPVRGEKQ